MSWHGDLVRDVRWLRAGQGGAGLPRQLVPVGQAARQALVSARAVGCQWGTGVSVWVARGIPDLVGAIAGGRVSA